MSLRQNIKHLDCCLRKLNFFASRRSISSLSFRQKEPEKVAKPLIDPYASVTEDPVQICSDLWVKTFSDPAKSFTNLTGFLSKIDLWVLAYQRCYAHETGTFPLRNAIHAPTLVDLVNLRDAVVGGKFKWNKKLEQQVRSPNEKPISMYSKRKLRVMLESGKTCFQDRIVQEVLMLVLEPIFEARFSSKSHAFRPGRNAHTAIRTIRSSFAGYLWFLRGDLSEIYDTVDGNMMIDCVEKAVKDTKIVSLIRTALRAPSQKLANDGGEKFDNWRSKRKKKAPKKKTILNPNEPKPDPYWLRSFYEFAPEEASKVPCYGHCGILSPLLANVCLHELDLVMEQKIQEYFRPSELDSIWKHSIDDGCHNPAWPEFVPSSGREKTKKMDYIRYGGHFLIGIRGRREDAVRIRQEIVEVCETKLGIRLEESKVEIEHISRGINFLDHTISCRVIHPTLRYISDQGTVVNQKGAGTLLSVTASLPHCMRQFRKLELVKGITDPEPLPCIAMLYSSQAHTNAQMNKFLETMADWYRYADNRKKVVGFCAYVIRSSLAKLYAARYKLKSRAKVYKIASRNLSRPLRGSRKDSVPDYSDLLQMGLVDDISGVQFSHMSLIPSCDYTPLRRDWIPDHERFLKEYIKLDDPKSFSSLHKIVKSDGLTMPQEELSEILWQWKTVGVRSYISMTSGHSENVQ